MEKALDETLTEGRILIELGEQAAGTTYYPCLLLRCLVEDGLQKDSRSTRIARDDG